MANCSIALTLQFFLAMKRREPGPKMAEYCGKTLTSVQMSDQNGNIQDEMGKAAADHGLPDPAKCMSRLKLADMQVTSTPAKDTNTRTILTRTRSGTLVKLLHWYVLSLIVTDSSNITSQHLILDTPISVS